MIIFLTITTISFSTIYLYFNHISRYWSRRGVPTVRVRFPYGNFRPVALHRSSIGEVYLYLYRKLKTPWRRYAGVYFFTKPELMVFDPELVKLILTRDSKYFLKSIMYHDDRDEEINNNLQIKGDGILQELRQKLHASFSSDKLQTIFPIVQSCSSGFSAVLHKHDTEDEPINIKELAARLATDISSCLCGLQSNKNKKIYHNAKNILEPGYLVRLKRIISYFLPKMYNKLKLNTRTKSVDKFFLNTIMDNIADHEKKNVNDFLRSFLTNLEEFNMDNKAKATIVYLLFHSNLETFSSLLIFILYEIAINENVQYKMRAEINEIMTRNNNKLDYSAILQLEYLENVIYETIRLHPPVPIIHEKCLKNYRIPDSDLVLKKGTAVIFPIIGLHADPELFPDPENFNPERFKVEEKNKRHPFTFLPFGGGFKSCVGSKLVMLQMKIVLSLVLKDFKFKLDRKMKLPIQLDPNNFISNIRGKVWLKVKKV